MSDEVVPPVRPLPQPIPDPPQPGRSHPIPLPRAPKKAPARVGVNEAIFHVMHGRPVTNIEARFNVLCETEEFPYTRREVQLGKEWVKLDSGWLEDRWSVLVVENEEGRRLQTIPTPEERKAVVDRVIEVGICPKDVDVDHCSTILLVPAAGTERFRFAPHLRGLIHLRCVQGAKVTTTVFPL